MSQSQEQKLKLVVDNSQPTVPLEDLLDEYAQGLDEQRAQLLDDLQYFQKKLSELQTLDPADFTGLGAVYREHEKCIRELLENVACNSKAYELGTATGAI